MARNAIQSIAWLCPEEKLAKMYCIMIGAGHPHESVYQMGQRGSHKFACIDALTAHNGLKLEMDGRNGWVNGTFLAIGEPILWAITSTWEWAYRETALIRRRICGGIYLLIYCQCQRGPLTFIFILLQTVSLFFAQSPRQISIEYCPNLLF